MDVDIADVWRLRAYFYYAPAPRKAEALSDDERLMMSVCHVHYGA